MLEVAVGLSDAPVSSQSAADSLTFDLQAGPYIVKAGSNANRSNAFLSPSKVHFLRSIFCYLILTDIKMAWKIIS